MSIGHKLVALMLVGMALGMLACDAKPPEPLTLDEYVVAVCDTTSPMERGSDSTWGDVKDWTRDEVDRLESVVPPPELAAYHDLILEVDKVTLDVLDDTPDSDVIDPIVSMKVSMALYPPGGALKRAEEELPDYVRSALKEHGCIVYTP